MKEQIQVDNNDEQKQGKIIGALKEDVEQKIRNNSTKSQTQHLPPAPAIKVINHKR